MSLSVGLVCILLMLISLDGLGEIERPQKLTIREVRLQRPEPPKQPESDISSSSKRDITNLSVATIESPVTLTSLDMEVEIPAGQLSEFGKGKWGDGIGKVGAGFGLSDLDSIPTVIFDPLFRFPEELSGMGINRFEVEVHILIDEKGRTFFRGIVKNPYPRYISDIKEYVSKVRFSPPTVSGIKVKAEYLWPVVFTLHEDI